ncbi:MAG: DUF493 domain-containing protein [Flavobacteriaceae bacterium]
MSDKAAFYKKLKKSLDETSKFPCPYLYKFIVPGGGKQIDELRAIFETYDAQIDIKPSRTGKYDSVSIKLTVESSDQVIENYKKVENIEGIISL